MPAGPEQRRPASGGPLSGAAGLPGVDSSGPGSREVPRDDPAPAASQCGSLRPLHGPGVAGDSSGDGARARVGRGGRWRPQGEPAAPRPPPRVTPSPAGGGSKASSHGWWETELGAPGAGSLTTQAAGSEEAEGNRHPDARSLPPLPKVPPVSGPDLAPSLRCSSHPRGAARAGDHAPGAGAKSFFPSSLAAHRGRLLLSSLSLARRASAPPPPWGVPRKRGVSARGGAWGEG